jgi:hypothetical protein
MTRSKPLGLRQPLAEHLEMVLAGLIDPLLQPRQLFASQLDAALGFQEGVRLTPVKIDRPGA